MIFREKLLESFKEGLYLLVKYGLFIVIIVYSYLFIMDTRRMAMNGQQAAQAILEFQTKGWLPQFPVTVNQTEIKKQ